MGVSIVFQSITIHNIVQPLHIISQNYTYLNLFTLKTNGGGSWHFSTTQTALSHAIWLYVLRCDGFLRPWNSSEIRPCERTWNVLRPETELGDWGLDQGWRCWAQFMAMENGKTMNYLGTLFGGPIKWRIKLTTGFRLWNCNRCASAKQWMP